MKQFIIALFAVLALAAPAFSTDVAVSSQTVPGFTVPNLGQSVSLTATVTNGSSTVTSSTAFRTQWVGLGGFTVAINGTNYTVSYVTSTSSLTLTTNYVGTSGAMTMTWYPYVIARLYSSIQFYPGGSSTPILPGAPGSGPTFRQYAASILNVAGIDTLYLPQMVIPATTDGTPSNTARITVAFHRPEGALIGGPSQFFTCASGVSQYRIPTTTPTSWKDICAYNAASQVVLPTTYYTAAEIDSREPSCTANQIIYNAATGRTRSCLTVGSGLQISGATLSTVAGTNLTGVVEAVNFARDCGGVGDGSTNNASAFASCIAGMSDGATLYLPPGNYKTNSQIAVNKRINLVGNGVASTITCNVGAGTTCILFDRGASQLIEQVRIEDFAVIGASNSVLNGMLLRNLVRSKISNVHISTGTAAGGYGLVCEGCLINTFSLVKVSNSTTNPYGAIGTPEGGFHVLGSSLYPSNANLFLNCIAEPGSGYGIFLDGASGTTGTSNNWITGGTIEGGSMTYGIYVKSAGFFSVESVHVEDLSGTFTKANIKIENSSKGFIGHGSFCNNLELVNADDIVIDSLAINSLSIDSNSDRTRVGALEYNLSGTATFADNGNNTIYDGQIRNAAGTNSTATGPSAFIAGTNIFRNGGAEYWNGSTNPKEWGVSSGNFTKTGTGQADTRKLYGDYAAKVPSLTQTALVNAPTEEVPRMQGKAVTITAWIYIPSGQATQPQVALQLWLNTGSLAYGLPPISTTDTWVRQSITGFVTSDATAVQAAFVNSAALYAGTYYIDGVSLTYGRSGHVSEAPRLASGMGLDLYNATAYRTRLQPSDSASADQTYTLPAADGNANDVLITNGSKVLSFSPRAKLESTSTGFEFFPYWKDTAGTLSISSPLFKSGSDVALNGGNLIFVKGGQTLTLAPHASTGSYTWKFPQSLTGADGCLQINSTGQVSITGAACGSGGGGGGITSITATTGGAQSGPGISFASGTSGTDFAISGAANTITFNLPDGGPTARGVITTGTQTLAGAKTLTGALAVTATTTARQINPETDATYDLGTTALRWGSVHVSGSSLVVHGDNANTKKVTYGYSGSTGTIVADASSSIQLTTGANSGLTINTSGNATFGGSVSASSFAGSCASCTNISASNITSGTLPVGSGGTGATSTPTNGQLLIGNGTTYTANTLAATANQIKVTNTSGSITLGVADAFDISGNTSTAPNKKGLGSAIPATCNVGETYFKTDATAGVNLYGCTSANTWTLLGDGGGGGGSTSWDAITNPAGSLSLSMAARTTTFTWGSTTGASTNLFTLKDTASNTGTGYVLSAETASSSAAKPFRATAGGTLNGVEVNTSGVLAALGTGGVDAAALVTGTVPLARLSGITTSQLSATANISNAQLANSSITINGTTNQVTVSTSPVSLGGSTTLSLPQSIHTAATPRFAALGLGVAAGTTGLKIEQTTGNPLDITNTGASKFTVDSSGNVTLMGTLAGHTIPSVTADTYTLNNATQTLAAKTLTTPTIASFTNATHNHTNAAGGGQLTDAALSSAVTVAKGGTGATTLTGLLLGNGTSAVTAITTSAGVAGALSDETGSGALMFGTSPTATNVTLNQAANGDTIITSTRATDTSPTGNFFNFKNAAGTTLAKIDITGALTVTGCTGCGGVTGPGSSTNTAIARWNGTGGSALLNSAVTIDGSGNVGGVGSLTMSSTLQSAYSSNAAGGISFSNSSTGGSATTEIDLNNASNFVRMGVTGSSFTTGTYSANEWFVESTGLSNGFTFNAESASKMRFMFGGTEQMRLTSTGLRLIASSYYNLGSTAGSGGYGMRDNSGTVEIKNSGGSWSAPSYSSPTPSYTTLTDGATITWTLTSPQLYSNATVTLGGNRTLAFSGTSNGASGTLIVKQDATGGRTLTLPAGSKVAGGGGGACTLSSAANAIDVLTFTYDGTNYLWTCTQNFN